MQRSGTSVTLAALAGHPEIAVPAEEIHTALFAGVVAHRSPRGETAAERTASLGAVFDHERSSVRVRDLARDGETQARPLA